MDRLSGKGEQRAAQSARESVHKSRHPEVLKEGNMKNARDSLSRGLENVCREAGACIILCFICFCVNRGRSSSAVEE